jgi:hypothetical protein
MARTAMTRKAFESTVFGDFGVGVFGGARLSQGGGRQFTTPVGVGG